MTKIFHLIYYIKVIKINDIKVIKIKAIKINQGVEVVRSSLIKKATIVASYSA